ncbi:phosphoglucomutase [Photobacterium angustum]|uniref:phospho-sugar mutase n=1 Tax=Photobacterium angustum TaxID=661 RepID=UPI0005E5A9C2|nr:phospho-sugar mutase [Photobacterium angustum]KJF94084.1 phosphoglucomutase [Photobacterium angustum]KJG06023.1 phosphoglucomutase [Photobacterium angustum]PSV92476.1 phospho-sugar mutase [Photobacterium angustum]PSW76336.1 phospho-sugar mutase [Photobacterium angustum]
MNSDIARWLERDPDPKTRNELEQLIKDNNQAELTDRFDGRLAFGTAGLRGVVGAGPNRMNRLVIQETAAGLGQYLLRSVPEGASKGVVIGYDGRPDSQQFAHDTASVLTAQGIKVYLTVKVAPTPVVAFGVKHLHTAAAVVVTASHNPPQYNGFKVYWENGAQIIPPQDAGIADEIDKATKHELSYLPLEEAVDKGLLVWLDEDYYQDYRQTMNTNPLLMNHNNPQSINIAYTAMHGVGAEMAETLLADAGFDHVYSVAAQREPDGTFPTVKFPNPEETGAMDLVIAEAKKHDAVLACANDPDADRFAVAVRREDGEYQMLTGDQVGTLFGYYLLSHAHANQNLVGNTIVSSSLLGKIATTLGARYYQTLTGFKWLTNVAMAQQTEEHQFLFAYEEALGYTIGSKVWDKDGLSALVAFAQLTAELHAKGLTIWDQLEAIYREHGLYINAQRSIALDPIAAPIGDTLRHQPPTEIAGLPIVCTEDYKQSLRTFSDGTVEGIELPVSDVLIYHLQGGARVIVRPSGTEPKIKCYYEVVEPMLHEDTMIHAQQRAQEAMDTLIEKHQQSL